MLRFFLVFLLLQGVLFAAELTAPARRFLGLPGTEFFATLSAKLIQLFDSDAFVHGKIIQSISNGFGVSRRRECNGVEAAIVLVAAMLSSRHGIVVSLYNRRFYRMMEVNSSRTAYRTKHPRQSCRGLLIIPI